MVVKQNEGPNYVSIWAPDTPAIHGKWFDVSVLGGPECVPAPFPEGAQVITFVPTGMIDVRDDGAVAEIFMLKRTDNDTQPPGEG
jgi:hypothetical protein